jgi:hypothetical protein
MTCQAWRLPRVKEIEMKLLSFLFWMFVVLVAAAILLPVVSIGFVLLCTAGVFLIWLLPILIIAASDQTSRGEKFCWILAIIFLSWFAWIFYFFLAPLKPVERDWYYY